jgi:hypothetical protein
LPRGDRYETVIQQFPAHQLAAFTPPHWDLHRLPTG